MRTLLTGTVVTLGAVLSGLLVAPDPVVPAADAASAAPDVTELLLPTYRFVSAPDLLNSDIGDVSRLPGYRPGGPNSINADFEAALDLVHDQIAGEDPDDVLVAGDLVEGHWTRDRSGLGYFGAKRGAPLIRAAGRLYYSQWRERFTSRGLTVHTAVGDHEIGDNPWRRTASPDQRANWANFGVFKDVYADQLVPRSRYSSRPAGQAHRTAYAKRLSPEVQLVTLDVFRRTGTDVVAEVDADQLRWVDRVLAKADRDGVDWIIVQGHVPVLAPVRRRASSGLSYRRGAASALWRTMREHGVDLYLSGEVHDVTVKRQGGITQISHGGIFGGLTNYLTGEVTGSTMRLELDDFSATRDRAGDDLWGLDPRKAQPRVLQMSSDGVTGSLVLGADQTLISSSGRLVPGLD